jgi:predicted nucleic acid-binding Zn ribbon protein
VAVEPLPSNRRPSRHIAEALDRVRLGLGAARVDALPTIEANWSQLVGSRLASVCRVESIRDGRLVVACDAPAVAEQIRWQTVDLVGAVNALCDDTVATSVETRVQAP